MFCAADMMNKRIVRWCALVTNFTLLCLLGFIWICTEEILSALLKGFMPIWRWQKTDRLLRGCYLRCLKFGKGWRCRLCLPLELDSVPPVPVPASVGAGTWNSACYWARAFPFSGCSGLTYGFFSRKKTQMYSYHGVQIFLQIGSAQYCYCLCGKILISL